MGLLTFKAMRNQTNTTPVANPTPKTEEPIVKEVDAPQEPKAEQKPQPKADKDTKKKAKVIEPKDANDALQHILSLAKSGAITTTLSEDGKQRIFANAPEQNVLWTLRKCFRMLGGEHNGEKDDFKWTVPMEFLMDPNKAVATKSAKQQEYEQKVASGEIKPRTANDNDNANDNHKGKGKYTEEQVIKLMQLANATLSMDACKVLLKAI